MQKTFIGPHLRRLRLERGETQGAMAKVLGISPSYVNLLENNERSVSVQVLLRVFEAYGVDWRDIVEEDGTAQLADLRAVIQGPLFSQTRPDLPQLRAALVHAPGLVQSFMTLYRSYQVVSDQLLSLTESGGPQLTASPEAAVHDVFRRNRNHYRELEEAAEAFWPAAVDRDELYVALKRRLRDKLGLNVRLCRVEDLPGALRQYDESRREILLSEALDHPTRTFQLVHRAGLLEQRAFWTR